MAVKVSVTNSKSRGNSTANTPEMLTVFTFYKFSLHENSFYLVFTGTDKYWIIKYSREIILYYISKISQYILNTNSPRGKQNPGCYPGRYVTMI
jgi:hypothetical protein